MPNIQNTTILSDALADLEHALHLQTTGQRDPNYVTRLGENPPVLNLVTPDQAVFGATAVSPAMTAATPPAARSAR